SLRSVPARTCAAHVHAPEAPHSLPSDTAYVALVQQNPATGEGLPGFCLQPELSSPELMDKTAGNILALPHFRCNLAVDWRNLPDSREPLCDCFGWGFAVCGDFFEASGWSFAVRSFRRHTLPSPSRARRSVHRVLRAAVSPAAGTAAIPGS